MNVCLANCINNLPKDGKGRKYLVQEMYGNLVEMLARAKSGDLSAMDEFIDLYCMGGDVAAWKPGPFPAIRVGEKPLAQEGE